MNEAIALIKKLITIPSTSRNEQEISDFLFDYFTKRGQKVNRHFCNLWMESPHNQPGQPTLLLNAHIDTVKPNASWQRNPFEATVEGDTIYGLGSNDDLASLVSLYFAFEQLSAQPQTYNLIFAASAEEEVSGKQGMESLIKVLPKIDFALIGEPTGMQPAIAEKGLMVLDCEAQGKSGHAARNEGVNAIYEAMQDIEWFRTFRFPKKSDLLGEVKTTVTLVNAGTQHNVIPDKCSFVVDVRTNELYSNEEVYEIIKKHVKSNVVARSFRLNSSSVSLDHPYVQHLVNNYGKIPFGSATLSDQALIHNCPTMKMGPGDSARSHTADEFIRINEIEDAIQFYVETLMNFKF
ncbi:MAG: M20 family metallo-hydrolase [Paludibacteraceae bacterium]|nr:M20 family metallo-hydrolase [Paludibacteraceae bacterium]